MSADIIQLRDWQARHIERDRSTAPAHIIDYRDLIGAEDTAPSEYSAPDSDPA